MRRILNIKKPALLSIGLIKTRSGKLVCSILLVAFTVTVVSFSSVLMPSEVYSSADDCRQFQSGVDPISGSSEVFSPLFGGDELFVNQRTFSKGVNVFKKEKILKAAQDIL